MTSLADHYDARAPEYDDSWHPSFARNVHALVRPQPGDKVLDLACGTGLFSLLAADAVGPHGHVVGIDISGGMLDEAKSKAKQAGIGNVEFHKHSISELQTLEAVKNKTFDLITCISALVLLPEVQQTIASWNQYLKPGGRLVTDVTHRRSQVAHISMERVARDLRLDLPFHRLNFDHDDSLRTYLEQAGFKIEDYRLMSQIAGRDGGSGFEAYTWPASSPRVQTSYRIEQAKEVFDTTSRLGIWQSIGDMKERSSAAASFKDHWTSLADTSGNVLEVDGVFVVIGRKSGMM